MEDIDIMKDIDVVVFILSLIDILAPLPFEIIPGYILDRARPDQIQLFREYVNSTQTIHNNIFNYERSQVREVQGKIKEHTSYVSDALPPDKWKYWTLSYDGHNCEYNTLQQASMLLKEEIEFGYQLFYKAGKIATAFGSAATVSYLTRDDVAFHFQPTISITKNDLLHIREYYDLIMQLTPEYGHIKKSLTLFDNLRALPSYSNFILIGLFSIIETLISHSPELDFYHDSIKHQIRTKIPLLRKHFIRELDYKKYFGNGANEDKIGTVQKI